MKRYLRQILVFVLAFAMLANPLLYSASASSATSHIMSDFWDFSKEYWVNDWQEFFNSFENWPDDPLTDEEKAENINKAAYEKIVDNLENNIGTTTLYNEYSVMPELPLDKAYQMNVPYYVVVNDGGGYFRFYAYHISPHFRKFSGYEYVDIANTNDDKIIAYTAACNVNGNENWAYEQIGKGTLPFSWNVKNKGKILFSNSNILEYNQDRVLTGNIYYKMSDNRGIITKELKNIADVYNNAPSSRVGSFSADYGYKNGDGQQIIADNIQIVNEAEKSIYNPITGDTTTYGDWAYDYANRSYNVTTTTGDTMTVTYGDEYVTITEGETVYNINYITYVTPEPSEPEPSEPDTSEPDGNGDNNGNGNGNNNNDNDDSNSLFDVLGELLGSIIKAISDLFTPIIEAFVNAIVAIIGKVLEGLGAFVELLLRFFEEIPKMFTGFTEFLTAVFPFMPSEFVTLIIFSLLLMIVAAVIKKFV